MPRIRTIKPEFPQSESIGRLSRDARLLFIQLWTLADDSGRTRASSRMLASLLYPYDDDAPSLLGGWLGELERQGLVRLYTVDGTSYLDIPKWLKHQKIDRPSHSRLPEFIEGSRSLDVSSPTDLGPRTRDQDLGNGPRTVDMDHGPSIPARKVSRGFVKASKAHQGNGHSEPSEPSPASPCWQAYDLAYHNRYGAPATRNARTNSLIKQFCQRVPIAEAPAIIAHFIASNRAWYVTKKHSLQCAVADAEALRTEWLTGRHGTDTQARQADKAANMGDIAATLIAEAKANGH